jgi:cytosol aminopeptidase
MSTSAFVLPYDHQTSGAVVDGVDAAKLWSTTPQGEKLPKAGTTRTFYNTSPSKLTTVSSLGDGFATKKAEEKRELVRKSVGRAVKDLKELEGVKDVAIDASVDPHAAGMLMSILYC